MVGDDRTSQKILAHLEEDPRFTTQHETPYSIQQNPYHRIIFITMAKFDATDLKYQVSEDFKPDKTSTWDFPVEKDGWMIGTFPSLALPFLSYVLYNVPYGTALLLLKLLFGLAAD
jgi:hypothetical protein